jgi:TonB family protein
MRLASVPRALTVAVLLAMTAGCATRRPASPFVTDACPLSAGPRYAVLARAVGSGAVDSAYLAAVARAVVHHWDPAATRGKLELQTPNQASAARVSAVRHQVIPLWSWRPGPEDTAEVAFTIRRGGAVGHTRVLRRSRDRRFDQSLIEAVTAAELSRDARQVTPDTLPGDVPPGAADSIAVTLRFGGTDAAAVEEGIVLHFARQSQAAIAVGTNKSPNYPAQLRDRGIEGDVRVQFRVTADGRVQEGSVQILSAAHPGLARAVVDVIPHYRFQPALLDCQVVPTWVEQPIAFRLRTSEAPSPSGLP